MRLYKAISSKFVIACLALSAAASADDEVAIKDLPKEVIATINGRYPKAMLTQAHKSTEDKLVVYDVELTSEGILIEIAVQAGGRIDWVAVDLAIERLPKPVLAGIRKKYPAAKLDHASTVYTVKDGKDHLENYYVELNTKAGKSRTLEVSAKGVILEDDEAE